MTRPELSAGSMAPQSNGLEPAAPSSMKIEPTLLVFLAALIALLTNLHRLDQAHFDFGVFYYAARMFWEGARTSLYDLNAQRAFQAAYGRESYWLSVYPPFTLLPFLPIALLPPTVSFIVWTILCLGVLWITIKKLYELTGLRYGNWTILLAVAFLPVLSGLLHGQVSILALPAYVWCYRLWKDGRRFAGGAVLALLTFKLQLVAGFLGVLVLRAKWRELAGFAAGCLPLIILSVVMVGPRTLLQYPDLVAQSEASAGVNPLKMASFHGLLTWISGSEKHGMVVAFVSVAVLCIAAWLWKDLTTGFCSALIASMLVSYHCYVHDVSLAIIPFCLLFTMYARNSIRIAAFTGALLSYVPLAIGACFCSFVIPLIAGLVWIWWRARTPKVINQLATAARRA